MAASVLKLDDGSEGLVANCFPVRTLIRREDDESGAWLVAQRVEQRRRFKAVLCAKPRTYDEIRRERQNPSVKTGTAIIPAASLATETPEVEDEPKVLDGFFLMKHCCVEDPTDLCSVNISGQNLSEANSEDFKLFDNVAYVNAAENILPLNCFDSFPILRELELPLNGLRRLKINVDEFRNLELLDLSYNNLSPDDFLPLGLLQNLRILQLTGNNLHSIPADLAIPCASQRSGRKMHVQRFPKLEILMLDENRLEDITIFAALAGLRQLRHLSLSNNSLHAVPQLILMEGRMITQIIDSRPSTHKKSSRSKRSKKSAQHLEERMRTLTEARIQNQADESKADDTSKEQLDHTANDLMADFEELNLDDPAENFTQCDPLPPPFPELRYLNVAHNKICDEDSLLAVATWPCLSELIIHDNPLITERTGDPPILKRFLTDRLGIRLHRKKAPALEKPTIEVKLKPERLVNDIIPSVPRCNVDELLALEAPRRVSPGTPPQEHSSSTPNARSESNFGVGHPLPPIPATPDCEEETENTNEEAKDDDGEAFFMTQVDEPSKQSDLEEEVIPPEKQRKSKDKLEKYSGYDILFEDDGTTLDPDIPETKDIAGNIQALRYALRHPVVHGENRVDLEKPQRPFHAYERPKPPQQKRRKPKAERVHETLLQLRKRTTVSEIPLDEAITDPEYLIEAKALLSEVQRRYNRVRVSSMKNARKTHIADIQDVLNNSI